jgi:hypothetical protein
MGFSQNGKPGAKLVGVAHDVHELVHGEQGLDSLLPLGLTNKEMVQVHGAATHLPELLLDENLTLPLSSSALQKLVANHPAQMINWGDPCCNKVGVAASLL